MQKMNNLRKKPDFEPIPKFTSAFVALAGQTLSGNMEKYFKIMLDSFAIYARFTYGDEMGMTLKS